MERQYADMQQSIAALREQVRQNDESIEMNKMQYDKYASMAGDMDKREQQLRDKIKTLEDQYQVKLSKNKKKKR
jgi:chromosome segregation ATPase